MKRGPKVKPNSRRYIIKVRVNAEEKEKLTAYVKDHGITESEAIRAGIGNL